MSFTYNPKKRKRKRTHGFLARKKQGTGVIARRIRKNRRRLTV